MQAGLTFVITDLENYDALIDPLMRLGYNRDTFESCKNIPIDEKIVQVSPDFKLILYTTNENVI